MRNSDSGDMRVIVTSDCVRCCPGCCNTFLTPDDYRTISFEGLVQESSAYAGIMLTGGEPMLYPKQTLELVQSIRSRTNLRVFLYTALYEPVERSVWEQMLPLLSGIHFTLHAESTDIDIVNFARLSRFVRASLGVVHDQNMRVAIDSRLYDRYDFRNVDFSCWDIVRKLIWSDECPVPDHEDLFVLAPAIGNR